MAKERQLEIKNLDSNINQAKELSRVGATEQNRRAGDPPCLGATSSALGK